MDGAALLCHISYVVCLVNRTRPRTSRLVTILRAGSRSYLLVIRGWWAQAVHSTVYDLPCLRLRTVEESDQTPALCTFYLRALCTKGSACKFSHNCVEGSLQIASSKKRKRKELNGGAVEKTKKDERMKDISMCCGDCKETFIFSVKNQTYYALKGYEPPERCRSCREYRGSKR